MKQLLSYALVATLLPLLAACQTNMRKQFDQVQPGMDKHQVLELMGSPKASHRWRGKDRWRYFYFADGVSYKKEVHFEDGRAIYVGEPWKPEVAAEDQDRMNEEANRKVEEAERETVRRNREEREQFLERGEIDYEGELRKTAPPKARFEPVR